MDVLIFEDEIPAYEKLLTYIEKYLPECAVKGWGRSKVEVKHLMEKHPDIQLIFSDIELLDGTSLDAFNEVDLKCPIIFCTAFDQYLLQAFNSNGIAYLLKPYDEEKFKESIEKYKKLFERESLNKPNTETFKQLKHALGQKDFKKRFSIKKKDGIKLLSVDEITSFKANGDFCFAFDAKGEKHVVNYSMGEIDEKLDPSQFFRINRSEIINVNFIQKIQPYFKNRLSISIQGIDESSHTSTSRTPEFREWLER